VLRPWYVLGFASLLACGSAQRSSPSTRAVPEAVLPLPSSAALAVRVDLGSLRAELGDTLARELLLDAVSLGESPHGATLLERSLDAASLLWVAVAGPERADGGDKVLVVRGHFDNLAADAGFGSWLRRPTGLELLEVPESAQNPGGYYRVYRLPGDEMLIWAPRAELANVERALMPGLSAEPRELGLRPPERGTVSLAARPEPWLELLSRRYPELIERFEGLRQVEAFAEPTAGTWRADVFLDFATAERASGASEVVGRLKLALAERSCAVGVIARALSVSSFERNVRLQAWLEGTELETVRACVLGSGCCA
jgi:hypothetical protein